MKMMISVSLILCIFSIKCIAQPNLEEVLKIVPSQEKLTLLSDYMNTQASWERFSGVVLIGNTDSTYHHQAYGEADVNLPNQLETQFDIGSISKQFTAAAILKLVEINQLALDDPINQHLGSLSSEKWKKVSIHHLLTHTSGIPSLYQFGQGLDKVLPTEEEISLDQLVAEFKHLPTLSKPGKKYRYSNSGYLLLAAIIQEKSQQPYAVAIEQLLFKPYGLKNTQFGKPQNKTYALPFFNYRADIRSKAPITNSSWMLGGGGIYSTTMDLYRWAKIIQSDTFLRKDLSREYFKAHNEFNNGKSYGYGWEVSYMNGKLTEHDGANLGYIAQYKIYHEKDLILIALSNNTYDSYEKVGQSAQYIQGLTLDLFDILQGKEVMIPNKRCESLLQSEQKERAYSIDNHGSISIKVVDSCQFEIRAPFESNITLTDVMAFTSLDPKNSLEKMAVEIAEHLKNKKFRKIKPFMDKELKLLYYLGLFNKGFHYIMKPLGKISDVKVYQAGSNYAYARFYNEEYYKDLILYFKEGKMVGLFEEGELTRKKFIQKFKAYSISSNELQIDGFSVGEKNLILEFSKEDRLLLKQHKRKLMVN